EVNYVSYLCFFFFQAEDGIRDRNVTGVQTCALPIWRGGRPPTQRHRRQVLGLKAVVPGPAARGGRHGGCGGPAGRRAGRHASRAWLLPRRDRAAALRPGRTPRLSTGRGSDEAAPGQ